MEHLMAVHLNCVKPESPTRLKGTLASKLAMENIVMTVHCLFFCYVKSCVGQSNDVKREEPSHTCEDRIICFSLDLQR